MCVCVCVNYELISMGGGKQELICMASLLEGGNLEKPYMWSCKLYVGIGTTRESEITNSDQRWPRVKLCMVITPSY